MTDASPLSEWARLVLGSLAQAGIRDVVISPGSRSTPWVWAALHTEGMRCHSVLDERSAAFFALGQAKISGHPSLLVCTSGTAAAHYYPAVIEARLTSTPLVILSADRPFEFQAAKAPQTIDQIKLFGDYAHYFELGMPDAHPEALRFARRLAFQAVAQCRHPGARPSHINARARKPLEPQNHPALASKATEFLASAPPQHASPWLDCAVPAALVRALQTSSRGLLFSGPENPAQADYADLLLELAGRTGWPIVADAASPLRWVGKTRALRGACILDMAEWFFRPLKAELAPEFVLHFGAPMVSSALQSCCDSWDNVARYSVTDGSWNDPQNAATQLPAHPTLLLTALLTHAPKEPVVAAQAYATQLGALNQEAQRAVDQIVAETTAFSEAQAVRSIAESLPQGSVLVLGNSLPIRDFGAYVGRDSCDVRIVSQRGANGIDGLISGAAGVASAVHGPTTLVLGDLSFVHDLGGLWCCRELACSLVIVVLDNRGGRIFEQLPITDITEMTDPKRQNWILDHELELAKAAGVFGLESQVVTDAEALKLAVQNAHLRPGARLIVAKVAPSGARETSRHLLQRLRSLSD